MRKKKKEGRLFACLHDKSRGKFMGFLRRTAEKPLGKLLASFCRIDFSKECSTFNSLFHYCAKKWFTKKEALTSTKVHGNVGFNNFTEKI